MAVGIPVQEWEEARAIIANAWPISGLGVDVRENGGAFLISATGDPAAPLHPWTIRAEWTVLDVPRDAEVRGEWRLSIEPGFVGKADAHIVMPAAWWTERALEVPAVRDVPLTASPAPYLRVNAWRNPLASSSLVSPETGDLRLAPAEGFPAAFRRLGIRTPEGGGDLLSLTAPTAVAEGTREIRAVDLVLSQPRLAQRLSYTPSDTVLETGEAVVDVQVTYANGYASARGNRATLRVVSKYTPPSTDRSLDALFGLLLQGGDTEQDEIHLATLWIVSPPDAGAGAEPDGTWTPYAEYKVFWNLHHATRTFVDPLADEPITFQVPIGEGLAQPIVNAELARVNTEIALALASLNRSQVTGKFWTV